MAKRITQISEPESVQEADGRSSSIVINAAAVGGMGPPLVRSTRGMNRLKRDALNNSETDSEGEEDENADSSKNKKKLYSKSVKVGKGSTKQSLAKNTQPQPVESMVSLTQSGKYW